MKAFPFSVKDEADGALITNEQYRTEDAILKFLQKSSVLRKYFRAKCKEDFSSRKKVDTGAYFRVLDIANSFFLVVSQWTSALKLNALKK